MNDQHPDLSLALEQARGVMIALRRPDGRMVIAGLELTWIHPSPVEGRMEVVERALQRLLERAMREGATGPWVGWLVSEPPSPALAKDLEARLGQPVPRHPAILVTLADPEDITRALETMGDA